MLFAALLSAVCCLSGASLDVIREHHLETPAGQEVFLTEKLVPYTAKADLLNQEITALSLAAESLSSEKDQEEILAITEALTQKMGDLLAMLPVLDLAVSIEGDLEQIGPILESPELTAEQQAVADRVASLCISVSQ